MSSPSSSCSPQPAPVESKEELEERDSGHSAQAHQDMAPNASTTAAASSSSSSSSSCAHVQYATSSWAYRPVAFHCGGSLDARLLLSCRRTRVRGEGELSDDLRLPRFDRDDPDTSISFLWYPQFKTHEPVHPAAQHLRSDMDQIGDVDYCRRGDPVNDAMERYEVQEATKRGIELHPNVGCDVCRVRPITGPRWKCDTCPNVDMCDACYQKQLPNPQPVRDHLATHALSRVPVLLEANRRQRGRSNIVHRCGSEDLKLQWEEHCAEWIHRKRTPPAFAAGQITPLALRQGREPYELMMFYFFGRVVRDMIPSSEPGSDALVPRIACSVDGSIAEESLVSVDQLHEIVLRVAPHPPTHLVVLYILDGAQFDAVQNPEAACKVLSGLPVHSAMESAPHTAMQRMMLSSSGPLVTPAMMEAAVAATPHVPQPVVGPFELQLPGRMGLSSPLRGDRLPYILRDVKRAMFSLPGATSDLNSWKAYEEYMQSRLRRTRDRNVPKDGWLDVPGTSLTPKPQDITSARVHPQMFSDKSEEAAMARAASCRAQQSCEKEIELAAELAAATALQAAGSSPAGPVQCASSTSLMPSAM